MKQMKLHYDIPMGIIITMIGAGMFYMTFDMVEAAAKWSRIITLLLTGMGVMILIRGVRLTKKLRSGEIKEAAPIALAGLTPAMVMLALSIGYIVVMNLTGIYISTAVFMPVLMLYLGVRNWKVVIITTAGVELFIWGLFDCLLHVPLP